MFLTRKFSELQYCACDCHMMVCGGTGCKRFLVVLFLVVLAQQFFIVLFCEFVFQLFFFNGGLLVAFCWLDGWAAHYFAYFLLSLLVLLLHHYLHALL